MSIWPVFENPGGAVKEWSESPIAALKQCQLIHDAVDKVMNIVVPVGRDKYSELKNELGDNLFEPDSPTKYSKWCWLAACHGLDVVDDNSPESIQDGDFRIAMEITRCKMIQELHIQMTLNATTDMWVSPFEHELAELLLTAARVCCGFRSNIQTAQDVYGGYPFNILTLDDLIQTLARLSSPNAICLSDWFDLKWQFHSFLRELLRLIKWTSLKFPDQKTQNALRGLFHQQNEAVVEMMSGKLIQVFELTAEARPAKQWCQVLGHANSDKMPIPRSTFFDRINGKGKYPLDALKMSKGKYRLRTDQLPDGTKSEPLRNKIVEDSK